jgi:adenylyltransferase/sulfurtransferase
MRVNPDRFARQLGIPGFGPSGQAKLADARVFVLGAGGLGLPTLTYLAAAGVGSITFIDFDTIDITNLNRQILYRPTDVGQRKTSVALSRLLAFNPDVAWRAVDASLSPELALTELHGVDLAVDCADNDAARRVLASAAHAHGIPMLHGSVAGFEGSVALLDSRSGPCYGCLYPDPVRVSRPAVLGAVVGTLGALLASEAIRFLCGIGVDRRGQLLLTDLERGTFDWVRVPRLADCPLCGPREAP